MFLVKRCQAKKNLITFTLPQMNPTDLLKGYDTKNLSVGVLGGHSALDCCHGAKRHGLRTVCVAKRGREKTFDTYFRTRGAGSGTGSQPVLRATTHRNSYGCIDDCIVVDTFEDVLKNDIQKKLRELNTIFIHNRYFWVYFSDYSKIENDFNVPIFGNRSYVKLEERNQKYNQYHLLRDAGIRTPKIYTKPEDIDRPVIVKASEAKRGYERAFFIVTSMAEYDVEGTRLEREGKVDQSWRDAVIEEFVIGAPVNFNFFYSALNRGEASGSGLPSSGLELMGTDTRRQTNLDGFLRLTADDQKRALAHVDLKMIETGHIAVTVKESLLEKAFELGEKFVAATLRLGADAPRSGQAPKPDGRGIIGPFALQGAVVAEDGKEDIVIFDVSLRIPGSPGTKFTPYSMYLHGEPLSYGERIAMEIKEAVKQDRLEEIVT
jgi:5-formaminoimidazole-4-carboxamide-1-(beta)-D-ribofuranosyl 5'-monophosphate synthetase